jgi:transglutaminase-like putative cysteine protease
MDDMIDRRNEMRANIKIENLFKILIIFPSVISLLFLSVIPLLAEHSQEVVTVERSFPTPGPSPTGMAWDGKYLWIADMKVHKIFKVSPKDGSIEASIPSPGLWPMGLAWDGKHLWCVDSDEDKIFKLDPINGHVLKAIESPSGTPRGIAFDKKHLWILDYKGKAISLVSTADGTSIASIKAPAIEATGIAVDGDYLWVSDRRTDEIYKIHKKTGDVIITMEAPGPYTWGLSSDGKRIFNLDYQNDRVYVLKIDESAKYSLKDERKATVTYTHRVKNYGPGKITNFDAYIAIPETRDSQIVDDEIVFRHNFKDILMDRWGQKVAHYQYSDMDAPSVFEVSMQVKAKIYGINYFIDPEKVGTLNDIPAEIREKYLVNDDKYMLNDPAIQKAVKDAAGDENNPYWIARKIYNYCIDHIEYEMVGGWNVAPAVLKRGNGSCSEYTFVFIAMCRAAGLPARYVGSVVVRGDDASLDPVFHRWAEIYLPNYGWIPADPSGGDSPVPRDRARYFGQLSNRFLITTQSGGGSEYMGWTYNSNESFQTEPQTKVEVENFAEWEPILAK